jgi:hypothetical protein
MDTSESNQPARVVGEKKEQRSNIPIGLMGSLHSHQQCSTQEGKKKRMDFLLNRREVQRE